MEREKKTNDFNAIAPVYDRLARIVFGKSIVKAQTYHLDRVAANSKVLIIGGGTGWILNALDSFHVNLEVTYVELSSTMIKRARSRGPFNFLTVHFVEGSHSTYKTTESFDIIITNFLLDLFNEQQLTALMHQLSNQLKPRGQWFCADFVPTGKLWQRHLMQLIYWFFRLIARVEGKKLLHFDTYFKKLGFLGLDEEYFYSGMIKSCIYIRSVR